MTRHIAPKRHGPMAHKWLISCLVVISLMSSIQHLASPVSASSILSSLNLSSEPSQQPQPQQSAPQQPVQQLGANLDAAIQSESRKAPEQPDLGADLTAKGGPESRPAVESNSKPDDSQQQQQARKARAESVSVSAEVPAAASGSAGSESDKKSSSPVAPAPSTSTAESKKADAASSSSKKSTTGSAKASASSSSSKQPSTSNKSTSSGSSSSSSSSKPRLQANLGSTSSQANPSHYMSKNDAYSAIAEKHGALAHDLMRRSDKRRIGDRQPFGSAGIQKASGLGDLFNPISKMTDGGLGTLSASMRSIMKSKYSVPAYVASALLGAVALMAFYESPISPLPVPPLPEAPTGRFPPEMPNLPPNTQVPFRYNPNLQQQQQNYNQRSFPSLQAQPQQQQQQQQQQVLFPTGNGNQMQQRSQSSVGPVSQIASQLLSNVAKPSQIAQRKSGPDSDSSRLNTLFNAPRLIPANLLPSAMKSGHSEQITAKSSSTPAAASSGFLSYFGLGSGEASSSSPAAESAGQQPAGSGSVEPKGSASNGYNLINKFKSYFSPSPKAPVNPHMTPVSAAPSDPSRMNFVQNFMKDASLSLPRFLSPTSRKSSAPASAGSTAGSMSPPGNTFHNGQHQMLPSNGPSHLSNLAAGGNPMLLSANSINPASAQSMANLYNGMPGQSGQPLMAASRMQVGSEGSIVPSSKSKAGYGLMRMAHALLDTFTNGIAQRSSAASESAKAASSSQSEQSNASNQQESQQNSISPLQMASTMVSEFIANYPSAMAAQQQQSQSGQPQQQQQASATQSESQAMAREDSVKATDSYQPGSPVARSSSDIADSVSVAHEDSNNQHQQQQHQAQPSSQSISGKSSSQASGSSLSQSISSAQNQPQQQQSSVSSPSGASNGKQEQAAASAPQVGVSASLESAIHQVNSRKTRSVGIDYPTMNYSEMATKVQAGNQPSRAAQINAFVDYVADSYAQNKLLINFVMNQVGLSQAVPYVEHILASGPTETGSQ